MVAQYRFFRTTHQKRPMVLTTESGTEILGDVFEAEEPQDGAEITYVDYTPHGGIVKVHWRVQIGE